jgi:PAS domain S-box-containing protein
MNILDIRTVLISQVISNAICAIVIWILWRLNRAHSPEIGFWLADFIMQFTAILLIVLRGSIPNFLSIVVANALVIGGTILLFIGLEKYTEKKGPQLHNYIYLGLFIIIHSYFTYVDNNLLARNINGSVALLIICFQIAWLMFHRVEPEKRQYSTQTGFVFTIYCIVIFTRIIMDLIIPHTNDLFTSGLFDTLAILIYQMLFIGLTFSLFLMVNRRLFGELEQDIIFRKAAQDALKTSEEKFSSAFQNSPDAIILSSLDSGQIIEANESFFRLSEYTREECANKTTVDLNLWEYAIDHERYVEKLKQDNRVTNFESRFRKKSGVLFHCWISSEVITIKNSKNVISVIHNLSEKKDTDEQIRELSRFPEENPNPVLRIETSGKILYANPASLDLLDHWGELNPGSVPIFWGNAINEVSTLQKPVEIVEDFNQRIFSFLLSTSTKSEHINAYGREITEKVKASRDLEGERTKLKSILDGMNDGVYIVSKDYEIEYANPALLKEFGNTGGKKCYEYFSDLENPCDWCKNQNVFNGDSNTWEWTSPSTEKTYSIFETPIHNPDGSFSSMEVFHDITAFKKAEQELRESEGKFRAIFEQAAVGVARVKCHTGQYLQANRTFCEITGLDPDEVTAATYNNVTHPDDVQESKDQITRMIAGEIRSFTIEKRYLHKDGSIVWANLTATPLWQPGEIPENYIVVIQDISDSRIAQEALLQSELKYRTLHERMMDSYILTDMQGYIKEFNRSCQEMLGYSPGEMYQLNYLDLTPKKWHAMEAAIVQEQIIKNGFSDVYEKEYIAKNGNIIPIEMRTYLMKDLQGNNTSMWAIIRDISERKKTEALIMELNENLEEKVELRTRQLVAANKELETFSYSVSHDLRAPLRALDGFSLAVLEDYSEKLDQEGKQHLARIREASQKMAKLIDAMLLLSRVTKSEIRFSTVNLTELAECIAEDLNKIRPKRDVSWKISPGMVATADPALMKSALDNLLGNAWKFTSKHAKAVIEMGTLLENGDVVYYVKDDGAGFDMQYASKLFGAFQRMHSTSEFEGTGIGLATVQRIINKHGGRIWAEGNPEGGATFFFTLNE